MEFTHEHEELRRNLKRFIDNEINPHVDAWEEAEIFPAKELFKQMGVITSYSIHYTKLYDIP